MSFWSDLRDKLKDKNTASDISAEIYKKIAVSGVNMFYIIRPSFFIGQLSVLTIDFISHVEKFLDTEEGDLGEQLKLIIYLRENAQNIAGNINKLQTPLRDLMHTLEEVLEGERAYREDELEDELEDEPEPEDVEPVEDLNIEDILKEKHELGKRPKIVNIAREEMAREYEALKEELRVKFRQSDISENICIQLANVIADIYQECVQLSKELYRLSSYPEGDIATLLSILIDINYGLCYEMRRQIKEDVIMEDQFCFRPGLLTWSAHYLARFSEKLG